MTHCAVEDGRGLGKMKLNESGSQILGIVTSPVSRRSMQSCILNYYRLLKVKSPFDFEDLLQRTEAVIQIFRLV